ncbi:MAG TPA: radical SAM family heme chaperone HemW [Actinomycetota bacterium]|nr:radical SAM family heme chaperone HemW [Actinomycetota bacterium]
MTEAGLYVHIPFCLTRCGYCDFNAYAGMEPLSGRYVEALAAESEMTKGEWADARFVSVFLGGGTPTTLAAGTLHGLLASLRRTFRIAPEAEITCEANPDTVDKEYLLELRRAGVTRLSIGVQSFDPSVLIALERLHPADSAREAFHAARQAGFDDINLDLIYGADGESLESWEATLGETVALRPHHLSCYALTVEPATPLGRRVAAGIVRAPDPDVQSRMYERACDVFREAGYEHYEISNWAVPGHRSRHNLGYWQGRPYLGLGAGAHSHRGARRWWNVRPPAQYIEAVRSGTPPVGGEERLSEEDQALERLLLGLRVSDGVPVEWVKTARADAFVADGLAIAEGGRLSLTDRGMFVANDVVLALGSP